MDFKTDVFSLDVPHKTSSSIAGAVLPSNLDVFFRAKQKEMQEQYVTARIFMHKTETENEEWNYWFNPIDDPKTKKMAQLRFLSSIYETALMFYNIVVDLSWTLCYVCVEFACTVDGQRVSLDGMMPIEESYKRLRVAERNVTNPTADENPFEYLKSRSRDYSEAIDLIVEFWKSFGDSPVRKIYNYMKHKGKPIYKEYSALDNVRFFNMYVQHGSNNPVQIASDISDVQMELSLTEEIERLYSFDDEILFPYIQRLLQILEETIKPTPFLLT